MRSQFYDDLHDVFFYMIPNILYKFLLGKGAGHIIEYRPPLASLANKKLEEVSSKVTKFLYACYKDTEEAWNYL